MKTVFRIAVSLATWLHFDNGTEPSVGQLSGLCPFEYQGDLGHGDHPRGWSPAGREGRAVKRQSLSAKPHES
jgi:hypothetical protein